MTILWYLIPVSLGLGIIGLRAFFGRPRMANMKTLKALRNAFCSTMMTNRFDDTSGS